MENRRGKREKERKREKKRQTEREKKGDRESEREREKYIEKETNREREREKEREFSKNNFKPWDFWKLEILDHETLGMGIPSTIVPTSIGFSSFQGKSIFISLKMIKTNNNQEIIQDN